ncbi:MAG: efflux RND transporter permease subunit [Myxococcota bacterium]
MTLPEFSLRQTVLVNVLFFVCLIGGIAAFSRIPVEYHPDVALNAVGIATVWSGASAEEVERLVTQKLEEELSAVTDIDEMRSTSQADSSTILIDFDEMLDEAEYESAVNDVRAALDRVDDLPADAEEPYLYEIVATAPVVSIAVVDVGGVGPTALREIARDVARRLERLPGVKTADRRGAQEREIRVLVDRDAAARYGLGVGDVAARIRGHNLNLPAGTFEAASGETTVRARGDYATVDEILDTVVFESPNGTLVRLAEVARVEEGLEKRRYASRYGGHPAQLLTIIKKENQDAIELVERVDRWIAEYRVPPDVEIHKALDTAAFVAPQMVTLVENLALGILLVIGILWFTIGFRNAALTSIAIPFSFLTAMIFFPILDITINATTLIGMLLVSGMLVDDAIIVLENIYRKVEEGMPVRQAILAGTNEVMWPVVCAVMTTCAAFAPLLLVGGTAGKFVSILPKCVLVCLLASLFECLVILPAHYLDFGSRKRREDEAEESSPNRFLRATHRVREAVNQGIAGTRSAYSRSLVPVLEHRASFALLMVGMAVFAYGYARHLEVELFPGEFDTFNVLLESPSGYSLDQTEQVVLAMEAPLLEFLGKDVRAMSTVVGASVDSNYDRLSGPNLAMTYLVINRSDENAAQPERVLNAVKARMDAWAQENPAGIVELRVAPQQDGPPLGAPVEMRIQGSDYALGKAIAQEVIAFLEALPGVYNIEDNLKEGPAEARLLVDAQRASRHGLSFEEIALALRSANDGLVASSFRSTAIDEDIDIRVLLAERYRGSLGDLLDVELRTPGGYLVKLRDVADVELARGFLSYRRYDERRTVTVSAEVDDNLTTSASVNGRLRAEFADVEIRYPGVTIDYSGEFESQGEAFADLIRVFPVALLAIYMLLAALFRNYLQPMVVVAAIPFGLMGVVFGVGLLGYNVSFILMYATIGLTGVVVNDSLVMVDFINRAREGGMPLRDAVRHSGALRFRPILLTTLTTVMALLPMALGFGGVSKTYGPLAASISFGLIFAMVGTLFGVPLVYTSLIEGQDRFRRRWRRSLESWREARRVSLRSG